MQIFSFKENACENVVYNILVSPRTPGCHNGGFSTFSVCLKQRERILRRRPGGRLNKKDGLTRYGDSHVKDKTS